MYEERREKFSFKSFFLTILLVLLFIFLMLWLFPTKWDVKDLQSTYDLERLSVLYDEIFANNVARMKDAAIGYFTNERMPKKVGESKKLTLQEMYNLHLVLKMKDKDGNYCDSNKSYVEMTKYDEEYRLKVNLSCGNIEDYIIVYLGCYDYCDGICEKRVETSKPKEENATPVVKPEKEPEKQPEKQPEKEPEKQPEKQPEKEPEKQPEKEYKYEYKLVVSDVTTCTDWSNWDKNKITATNLIKVETKTEKEIISYNTREEQVGTKKETVVTGKKAEKYIKDHITELVVIDTKKVPTGKTTTKTVTSKVQVGTVEKFVDIGSGTKVPKDSGTTKIKNVTVDTTYSCSNCEDETGYIWEIWSVEPVYDVVTKTVNVPIYKNVNVYEEKEIPVYGYRWVEVKEEKETPIYETKKEPVYGDVTYYRNKTCTITKGYTDIKWSKNKADSELLAKGYKLTGRVEEV